MARYAQKECYDCHGVFPGNRMVRISEERRSYSVREGRMQSTREGGYVMHGGRSPARTTTHTSTRELLICRGCLWRRRRNFLLKAILLCGAVGAFAIYSSSQKSGKRAKHSQAEQSQESQLDLEAVQADNNPNAILDDQPEEPTSLTAGEAVTKQPEQVYHAVEEDTPANAAAPPLSQKDDEHGRVFESDLTALNEER